MELHIGPTAWLGQQSNAMGYVVFAEVSTDLRASDLRVTAAGFQPYLEHFECPIAPRQYTYQLGTNDGFNTLPELSRLGLSRLHVEGTGRF